VDAQGGSAWTPLVLPKSAALKKLIKPTNLKRPANSSMFGRTFGKLVHSPAGNMIIFIYEKTPYIVELPRQLTATCIAYDIRNRKCYGFNHGAGIDYPQHELSEISPFILFGRKDEPESSSLENLCKYIEDQHQNPEYRYESNFDALVKEWKNPNPHIRVATTQILGCYWTEHEQAAKTLEQMIENDSNPKVREAAKAALRKLTGLVEKHRKELKSLDREADSSSQ
jgi:hypothetical protein